MTLEEGDAARFAASTSALPDSVKSGFTASGLGKQFGDFWALRDVDISLLPGEVHCILGENGAGKSTLCNLVFGIHQASTGVMEFDGQPYQPKRPRDSLTKGVAMVHQHFSLVDELTVVDNLLLGQRFGRLDRKAEARNIVALAEEFGLELEPFKRINSLSVGQRQRVEIVKCLMQRPRLLILDEPTAVLLPQEIDALLEVCKRVAGAGCAVVMVTHKLAEIRRVADRVTVLRHGQVVARSTNPDADLESLVQSMMGDVGRTSDTVQSLRDDKPRSKARASSDVLQIDNLTYVDGAGIARLNGVTMTVGAGEIVGVAGVEGNGQTELGDLLAGLETCTSGRWFAGEVELTHAAPKAITAAGVGIIPEDRHRVGAVDDMSLADNLFLNRMEKFSRFGLINHAAQHRQAASTIEQFDIRARNSRDPFRSLSGGNQQKAVIARELATPDLKFLLAAQPTRGLDFGAVRAVCSHLLNAASKGVGVMMISSELDELIDVADRIIVMFRGRIIGECLARNSERAAIGRLMAGQSE